MTFENATEILLWVASIALLVLAVSTCWVLWDKEHDNGKIVKLAIVSLTVSTTTTLLAVLCIVLDAYT